MLKIEPAGFLPFFVLLIFFLFLLWLFRNSPKPSLYVSHLQDIKQKKPSIRARLSNLPKYLLFGSFSLFLLALLNPYISTTRKVEHKQVKPTKGIAIYLVLDQSGSMKEASERGEGFVMSKLDLAKDVSWQFVTKRPSDMIGLITFARSSRVLSPLTTDHQEILKQLNTLSYVKDKEEEGSAIGYAIFKTVNLITATRALVKQRSAYEMNDAIIILVTDGLQNPSPLDEGKRLRTIDLMQAATYGKSQNIKLYIINVDPKMATEPFAPNRRLLERVSGITEGKFYLAQAKESLQRVFEEINTLEKSIFLAKNIYFVRERLYLYPYFVIIGMVFLFLSFLLETTLLRKTP